MCHFSPARAPLAVGGRPEQDLRQRDAEPDGIALRTLVRHDPGRGEHDRHQGQGHAPRLQGQELGKPDGTLVNNNI